MPAITVRDVPNPTDMWVSNDGADPENSLRIDNDVWTFAPPTSS